MNHMSTVNFISLYQGMDLELRDANRDNYFFRVPKAQWTTKKSF